MPHRCPECDSRRLLWSTYTDGQPFDLARCTGCGVEAIEDRVPVRTTALVDLACPACPGTLAWEGGRCTHCDEDAPTWQAQSANLRAEASAKTWAGAAQSAFEQHRCTLALRFATAGALDPSAPDGVVNTCCALRVWLLTAVGAEAEALAEAQDWAELAPNNPTALACFAHQLELNCRPIEAAANYQRAREQGESSSGVALAHTRALWTAERHEAAVEVLVGILADTLPADLAETVTLADTIAAYAVSHKQLGLLDPLWLALGDHIVDRSANLLIGRAMQHHAAGRALQARQDLTMARRLAPKHSALPPL